MFGKLIAGLGLMVLVGLACGWFVVSFDLAKLSRDSTVAPASRYRTVTAQFGEPTSVDTCCNVAARWSNFRDTGWQLTVYVRGDENALDFAPDDKVIGAAFHYRIDLGVPYTLQCPVPERELGIGDSLIAPSRCSIYPTP